MTGEVRQKKIKIELYNDHFQNYKRYQIPKAQLVIERENTKSAKEMFEMNRTII